MCVARSMVSVDQQTFSAKLQVKSNAKRDLGLVVPLPGLRAMVEIPHLGAQLATTKDGEYQLKNAHSNTFNLGIGQAREPATNETPRILIPQHSPTSCFHSLISTQRAFRLHQ